TKSVAVDGVQRPAAKFCRISGVLMAMTQSIAGAAAAQEKSSADAARPPRCLADPRRRPALRAQIADTGIAVGLAQLLIGAFHDQRVVAERGRRRPAEESRDSDLAARRRQQIDAANHQIDRLAEIVDG